MNCIGPSKRAKANNCVQATLDAVVLFIVAQRSGAPDAARQLS
jgi:hypothetical protein